MKAISSSASRGINVDSVINCADNSGGKTLNVIAVKVYKSTKRKKPAAAIGDLIVCSVVKGDVKKRHEVCLAVIIRQKKEYRRANGMRIKFDDNAAVLVNDRGEPVGTEIKGPVAKEAVERFSAIGKIASQIV
ncbi:MAG: uL14 family ribosomal protein [Candidatus Aenigmarchaeota archaeon]|nr:uL14 family ribosomal protein [Candidatus Aenigmarchaeota archaeon]